MSESGTATDGIGVGTGEQTDSVKFISGYLEKTNSKIYVTPESREAAFREFIQAYQDENSTPRQREDALTSILNNVYFLFAHILKGKGLDADQFDDGMQNMALAVIEALDKFDLSRGTRFTSYLSGYFRNAIDCTIRDISVVVVPKQVRRRTAKMRTEAREAEESLFMCADSDDSEGEDNYPPISGNGNDSDNCEELTGSFAGSEESSESVETQETYSARPTTLGYNYHCSYIDDSYAGLGGMPSSEDLEDKLTQRQLINLLQVAVDNNAAGLTEKELTVLKYRTEIFGAPQQTLQEVSDLFATRNWRGTKEYIHQLQKKAMLKLQKFFAEYDPNLNILVADKR